MGEALIRHVRPEDVDEYWEFVSPGLKEAFEYFSDLYEPEDIKADLVKGTKQLWVIPDRLSFITMIEEYPRGKVLRVFSASGNGLDGWMDEFVGFCENLAELNKCKVLIAGGRNGWWKHLSKHHGMKRFSEYRKEI